MQLADGQGSKEGEQDVSTQEVDGENTCSENSLRLRCINRDQSEMDSRTAKSGRERFNVATIIAGV